MRISKKFLVEETIDVDVALTVKIDVEGIMVGLVECPLYSKQLITWEKMKKIVLQGNIEKLKKNPRCYGLYKAFWNNLKFLIENGNKTPIEYLMLPTSTYNCLKRQKFCFIQNLEQKYNSVEKLCCIRKMGVHSSEIVIKALQEWDDKAKKTIDHSILEQEKDFLCLWENRFMMQKVDIIIPL